MTHTTPAINTFYLIPLSFQTGFVNIIGSARTFERSVHAMTVIADRGLLENQTLLSIGFNHRIALVERNYLMFI